MASTVRAARDARPLEADLANPEQSAETLPLAPRLVEPPTPVAVPSPALEEESRAPLAESVAVGRLTRSDYGHCESFLEGTAVMAGTASVNDSPTVPSGSADLIHHPRHWLLARDPCSAEKSSPRAPRRAKTEVVVGTSRSEGTRPPDGVPVPVPVLIKLSLIDPLRTRCVEGQRVCAKMFREVLRLPAALDLLRDAWLRVDSAAPLSMFREKVRLGMRKARVFPFYLVRLNAADFCPQLFDRLTFASRSDRAKASALTTELWASTEMSSLLRTSAILSMNDASYSHLASNRGFGAGQALGASTMGLTLTSVESADESPAQSAPLDLSVFSLGLRKSPSATRGEPDVPPPLCALPVKGASEGRLIVDTASFSKIQVRPAERVC